MQSSAGKRGNLITTKRREKMDVRSYALILLSFFTLVTLVQVQGQGECFACFQRPHAIFSPLNFTPGDNTDTSCSDYQRQIEVLKNITISLGKNVIGISNLIKSAVITMKEDIATMRENITGVMETLEAVKSDVETVKSDVETVKSDVETVKEDVKAMKEDIETVKRDVEDVKEDIEDVKCDVEDIENDIEDVKEDMECVKSDVMMVKSEVETVKGDVDTVKNDVKSMKSDVDMMKNDTGMVRSEVETVTRYVERMKSDVVVVKNEVETVKSDVMMVKSDVWKVKCDVEVLKSEVETVKGDVKSIKSDADSIKSELENATETTEQDMETVKSNLTGLYIKLEQVQQICSDTELPPSETPPTATATPLIQPSSEPSDPGYICNGTSGWKRVVYLNMTDTSHCCPTGWRETGYSRRTCGRANTGSYTCDSAIFLVGGMEYTRVCGRVVGYMFGDLGAFFRSSHDIESVYANGLSLTHGSAGSREHIWTFAVGAAENDIRYPTELCPCDGGTSPVPEFLGNDYFCESGINGPWISQYIFHPNDPLWDGMNCLPSSNCCTLNDPPYFVKDIGNSTTDDIEARICSVRSNSNVAIELVELYVQ